MTDKDIIVWINNNLGEDIDKAIAEAKKTNPNLQYDRSLLCAMAYRETGFLIARYVAKGMFAKDIHPIIKGDYTQRTGETEKQYHGFGYWQIDVGSYPEFVKS